tara:strand:- start:388 stop:660 length:273 start_codon:yes stop_codon:yes gene_type:complete
VLGVSVDLALARLTSELAWRAGIVDVYEELLGRRPQRGALGIGSSLGFRSAEREELLVSATETELLLLRSNVAEGRSGWAERLRSSGSSP